MFDENRDGGGGESAVFVTHVGGEWRQIDRKLRRLAKRRAALDAEEARLLVEAKRAEVHVHHGYGSFIEYLERTCGYAPNTARDRLRVAEALEGLPVLRGALADGEVSFSALRELTRIATPGTEEEWLAAIEGCTAREIEDEMRGRKVGDRPGDRPDPAIEPRRVKLEMTPETYAMFLEARRALERETGEPMTDSDFMAEACRRVLAGDVDASHTSNQPSHQIAVSVCRDCGRGWQETGSTSIELSPAALERARCDATELGDVDGPAPAPTTRTIPAPVRRAVLARDHHRCVIPGCRSSRYVDLHHLVPFALGGPHTMQNLITLCTRHHTAAHDGRITITGALPALTITHADGRPYGSPRPPARCSRPRTAAPTRPAAVAADARRIATTPPRDATHPSIVDPHPPRPQPGPRLAPHPSSDVCDALVGMGVKRATAARAVEDATHLEPAPTFDTLLRAALRILHPPQPIAPDHPRGW